MWLTRLAVKRPITVTMGLVSLLVIGAISLAGVMLCHGLFNLVPVEQPAPLDGTSRQKMAHQRSELGFKPRAHGSPEAALLTV